MALQAILEDTFLLLAGLPESALDSDAPDPTELAAPGPLDGSYLECQIAVYVDVPSQGIHLQVRAGQLGCKNSTSYTQKSSLKKNMECCRYNHHVMVLINENCRSWPSDRFRTRSIAWGTPLIPSLLCWRISVVEIVSKSLQSNYCWDCCCSKGG